jgi:hypothetical protein
VAQLVVIDQILVAQRNRQNPLTDQARHRVFNQIGRTVIGKTAGKALDQPELPIGGAEQHRPGLRCHRAAVKRRHHRASLDRCKTKQVRATLCPHRASPCLRDKPLSQHDFLRSRGPMHLPGLRDAG